MGNPLGARKNCKFRAVSTAPSFNKTPMGNSTPPVPYPVYHDLANSTGTVSNVNFNGDPVYVLNQTTQSKCVGDNPGTAKGVKSGTVNGEIKPTSSSRSVNVGKKPLVRERDKCTLNSGNCPGIYVTEPAPAAPSAPQKKKSSSLNIHDVLDVLGFIPGLGAIPDLANAGIYAVQGNFAMAGLSVVAAVPGYGDAVKGGSMVAKGGKKLVKSVEKNALKGAEEKALKESEKKAAREATHTVTKSSAGGATIKKEKFYRSKSERRKTLKRDAEDSNSQLDQKARDHIKETDGKKVPGGYEVSHDTPLYTERTIEGKRSLDTADNMTTMPKNNHRDLHKTCGDSFHDFPR
ncbi:MAG: DUF4150 domain-containing protein [Verrucomicrobia bacterium]|nr:DUF4150 domain-containing protein [Deltaproteobacteria bacterium]